MHTVQIMDMAFRFAPSCDDFPALAVLVALRSRFVLDLAPLPPPMATRSAGRAGRPNGQEGVRQRETQAERKKTSSTQEAGGGGWHSTYLHSPPFTGWHALVAAAARQRGCARRGARPRRLKRRGTPPTSVDDASLCKTRSENHSRHPPYSRPPSLRGTTRTWHQRGTTAEDFAMSVSCCRV